MTTVTLSFDNFDLAQQFANSFRATKGVTSIWVDDAEPIPTLPNGVEECLASVRRAEEDIQQGRVHTLEAARAMFPRL